VPASNNSLLTNALSETAVALEAALAAEAPDLRLSETGTVVHVGGGIARVTGLPSITAEELVAFPGRL